MNGGKQCWVEAGKSGEGFRIGAISLTRIVINRFELAGVGDEDIMAQIRE